MTRTITTLYSWLDPIFHINLASHARGWNQTRAPSYTRSHLWTTTRTTKSPWSSRKHAKYSHWSNLYHLTPSPADSFGQFIAGLWTIIFAFVIFPLHVVLRFLFSWFFAWFDIAKIKINQKEQMFMYTKGMGGKGLAKMSPWLRRVILNHS